MLKKKPNKKPDETLPDEIPGTCVTAVFLGGYCEKPGPRRKLLGKLHSQAKKEGKVSLDDFKRFVNENWKRTKDEYESKKISLDEISLSENY
jgi:hypothetical protein